MKPCWRGFFPFYKISALFQRHLVNLSISTSAASSDHRVIAIHPSSESHFALQRKKLFLRLISSQDSTHYFLNGPSPASFSSIFGFSNKHYNFKTNKCEKMSIQYTVLGFEPITLQHESSPITTRPRFSPSRANIWSI